MRRKGQAQKAHLLHASFFPEKGAQSKPSTVLLPQGTAAASGPVSLSEKICQCSTLVFLLLRCQLASQSHSSGCPVSSPPCPVLWLLASPASEGTFLPKSQASKSVLPLGSPGCCLPSLSCIYLPSLQAHRGKPCRFPPANTAPLL